MTNLVQPIIGDKAASSTSYFERRNPLTGEIETRAIAANLQDAANAAQAAEDALPSWAALGPTARRAMLAKAADALSASGPDIINAMMSETGATQSWANFNLTLACNMIREAAALTTQINGEVMPSDKPGCLAMALREPAGVVLGIAPWNAPIILGVRAIATPLACGNTVILKASEICPRTHWLIAQSFVAAGFPPGVVNLITNAPADAADIVGTLIDHLAIRRINFTGSTSVGRIIAKRAAENLKPVLLELGGKAPFLVLDDADLDEAVKAAAFGAFFNQGQICMSTERIIVTPGIADKFVTKFAEKAATLLADDPRHAKSPLGAVVDAKTIAHVQALTVDAISKGAKQLSGHAGAAGLLMPATIIDGVTPEMRLFRDESFGPVVAVIHAKDESDAINLANATEYGLSAAIFTRDIARGLHIARQIKSGICHINGPTVHDEAHMPFGGTKASGYGRFGGRAGIDAFTELRWVTIETQPGHYPI